MFPLRPDNRAGGLGANPPGPRRPGVPPRRRPPSLLGAVPADPLAGYPQPLSEQELQGRAQGMVDPLLAALTGSIGRSAQAGAGAISGYTNRLAQELAGGAGRVQGVYGPIVAQQGAVDEAFANRLSGSGGGAELANRLRGIGNGNDPAVQAAAGLANQTATGAGNALFGKGSASLSALLAQQAAATDYAGKQPGIAGLAGVQQLGQLEQGKQHDLAAAVEQVRAQLPQILGDLRSGNDAKAANLANARVHVADTLQSQQEQQREFNVTNREKMLLAKMATETDVAKQKQDWTKFMELQAREDARAQAQIDAARARNDATIAGANTRAAAAAAGAGAKSTAKSQTAAIAKANGIALGIISKAAKGTAGGNPADPFAPPSTTVKPHVGSPAYQQAIHEAEVALTPIVGAYMTAAQITQMVQKLANAYFQPAPVGPPAP